MIINANKLIHSMFKVTFFCAFLLSDLYYSGVGRIFDYLTVILLVLLLRGVPMRLISYILMIRTFPLFLFSIGGIIIGLYSGFIPISIGLIIGILIILPISQILVISYDRALLENTIYLVLMISIVLFLFQFLMFYITGTYIDFSSIFGSISSRGNNESLAYFRAHGIFQEPNMYCSATFCLLALCKFFTTRRRNLENLACITMIISLSLWGILGGIILLIALNQAFRSFLFILILSFVFLVSMYFFSINFNELADTSVTVNRLMNLQEDPSYVGRVSSLQNIKSNSELIFGSGVSSSDFQERYGANAISFLLSSFGLFFVMLMLIYTFWVTKFSIWSLVVLTYLFVTFPLFSYAYFWIWFGLLIGLARGRTQNLRPLKKFYRINHKY